MTRSSSAEILEALRRCLDQCEHITAVGREAFLAEDLDAQMRRLAGERLIIALQSVLDDLPPDFVSAHDDLPFPLVRGMRNRLAHGYDEIDDRILWTTLAGSLPQFTRDVLRRLGDV